MLRLRIHASVGLALAILILTSTSSASDTEIYRCLLEDGTTGFQEIPCPELAAQVDNRDEATESPDDTKAPTANEDAFDFVNPFDEPANPPAPDEPPLPGPVSQNRAECEKTTRDAIDVIDFEMRGQAYTKEQGEEYLAELLTLTRQLRSCKRL